MNGFLLFTVFFIQLSILSANQLWIKGEIIEKEHVLFDSFVKIYQNNHLLDEKYCEQGVFNFPLDFEAIYVLEFGKNGYVSKKIEVSTLGLNKREKEQTYYFNTVISLFVPRKEMDLSWLQQPVGKAYFKPLEGFINDENYAHSIQPKLWLIHKISESYMPEKEMIEQRWEEYEIIEPGKKSTVKVLYRKQEKIVYKKVTHTWGGVFYFKNELAVPQATFDLETHAIAMSKP